MSTQNTMTANALPLRELGQAVISGQTKAADLTAGYLERIAQRNPEINAYLSVASESALRTAEDIDAAARRGDPLGPLAGVPVGIKDVIAIEGMPATAGSKILEGYTPPYTATAVRRLEEAGAVLLGKLNCDEFAMGSSNENSAYGAGAQSAGARIACRAVRAAARRRRSRRTWPWRRWARTPAAPSASRHRSAAWWACCRPTGASRATD